MRRACLILLTVLIVSGLLPAPAQSADETPARTAATIREALFEAQIALSTDPTASASALEAARAAYAGAFADAVRAAAPQAGERIQAGMADAAQAVANNQAAALAAARARVWTGILAGSTAAVEEAVARGDSAAAAAWLPVREFRSTTRFSRPSTGATLAVQALATGELSSEDALLAVRADLFDTYQGELNQALHELAEADARGFSVRRAELAALAEGYFHILSGAYVRERGDAALRDAQSAFAALRAATLGSGALDRPLAQVEESLRGFRAAPLTPEEEARRAGQLLRYLSLVPLEYGRGVNGTQVMHDFEIQEAITFHAGAQAAFSDLQAVLEQRDPPAAAQVRAGLDALGQQLDQAARGAGVAREETVEAQAAALDAALRGLIPEEWLQNSSAGDFDVIAAMLDQMEAAVISKDYAAAESARLEAYAIMEVGPEARLLAFAPQLKVTLEDLFWNGQGERPGLAGLIKNQRPHAEIQSTRARLDETLAEAQTILEAGSAPGAVATNAGMIMFREGLEAVIILASLMSSMKRKEEIKYRKPMWLGTLLAVAATALTWLLAHDVIQSLARHGEKLEAVVSAIAIAVLLVIMNWFFHKIYWTEWIAAFHARKRRIVSGEAGLWLGLVALGFTSVYREGFETVLFLQALVLESSVGVVMTGVAAALAAVCLIGFVTFRLQVNLPYKKMLVVTGVLIGVVLLQMVGKTVHVFQMVGWLPIHTIGEITLPYWVGMWFGIYATWEGLGLQAAAAAFVIGSYYAAEWATHRRRAGRKPQPREEKRPRAEAREGEA